MYNVLTKICKESIEGILICGINWGGTESESGTTLKDPETFFSDIDAYKWGFRNRLVKWFKLWGYGLNDNIKRIETFERSITYTNWLESKSPKISSIFESCKNNHKCIFDILESLKPRIIFFLSNQLLEAFNTPECANKAKKIFGECTEKNYTQHDITLKGKKLRRFKIGFQSFQNCDIISLPHPTGSKNLNDEYIASFKNDIGQIIHQWKSDRGVS